MPGAEAATGRVIALEPRAADLREPQVRLVCCDSRASHILSLIVSKTEICDRFASKTDPRFVQKLRLTGCVTVKPKAIKLNN